MVPQNALKISRWSRIDGRFIRETSRPEGLVRWCEQRNTALIYFVSKSCPCNGGFEQCQISLSIYVRSRWEYRTRCAGTCAWGG